MPQTIDWEKVERKPARLWAEVEQPSPITVLASDFDAAVRELRVLEKALEIMAIDYRAPFLPYLVGARNELARSEMKETRG